MNEQENQYQKYFELQKQFEALEQKVKQYLTKEAIARYGNIKAEHPDKAVQVVSMLMQFIQTNQIAEKLTDETFKEILRRMQEPKKEFKITKR